MSNTTVYSQANHLETIQELLSKAQIDFRKLIRDRAYALAAINGA